MVNLDHQVRGEAMEPQDAMETKETLAETVTLELVVIPVTQDLQELQEPLELKVNRADLLLEGMEILVLREMLVGLETQAILEVKEQLELPAMLEVKENQVEQVWTETEGMVLMEHLDPLAFRDLKEIPEILETPAAMETQDLQDRRVQPVLQVEKD